MKRIRNWKRWDLFDTGEPPEHPLFSPPPEEGTDFAVKVDRVWEWLLYFDHRHSGVYAELPEPGQGGDRVQRERWAKRAADACAAAAQALNFLKDTGSIPAHYQRFAWDFLKEPSGTAVLLDTWRYLAATQLAEPPSDVLRARWLVDACCRWASHPDPTAKSVRSAFEQPFGRLGWSVTALPAGLLRLRTAEIAQTLENLRLVC